LHVQNVITLSSHTKEGNPTGLPSTLCSSLMSPNHADVVTQGGAQQRARPARLGCEDEPAFDCVADGRHGSGRGRAAAAVSGQLSCPGCGGVLAPWGHAREGSVCAGGDLVRRLRPRRARCAAWGTHVLLPTCCLLRRADEVATIGAALTAKAGGGGHRRIAAALDRPASTVRTWLRVFAARAERVRAVFTALLHDVYQLMHRSCIGYGSGRAGSWRRWRTEARQLPLSVRHAHPAWTAMGVLGVRMRAHRNLRTAEITGPIGALTLTVDG